MQMGMGEGAGREGVALCDRVLNHKHTNSAHRMHEQQQFSRVHKTLSVPRYLCARARSR